MEDAVPAAQARHVKLVEAPVIEEYIPAAQERQVFMLVAESWDEYVPGLHRVQVVDAKADQEPLLHVLHTLDTVA